MATVLRALFDTYRVYPLMADSVEVTSKHNGSFHLGCLIPRGLSAVCTTANVS